MIIYHAVTTYHILKCAIHKLLFHRDEEAVILLPGFIVRIPDGLRRTKKAIFDEAIYFDWDRRMLPENEDNKEHYINYIDKKLKTALGNNFRDKVNEINVCRAEYFFGIYLCDRNYKFRWFEEADGRFSDPQPIINNDLNWALRGKLAREYGLYTGSNDCVTKKYINFDAQIEPVDDPLAEDFNVNDLLSQLDKKSQKALLDFFGVPDDIYFEQPSALFLTQHFANLRMLSYEEHALCYQLTADFFLEGYNIYYKWHPSDCMPYTDFMNDAKMISGDFPSELLSLVIDKKIDVSASVSSTGVYNLRNISNRILTFTEDYLQSFMQNHIYYFFARLAKTLPEHRIASVGLNRSQLLNMLDFGVDMIDPEADFINDLSEAPSEKNTLYLIGDSETITEDAAEKLFVDANENDVFVFPDQENESRFIRLLHRFPLVVKEINIAAENSEELDGVVSVNRVFVFTKNDKLRKVVEQMKYVKLLLNTGARTFVEDKQDKDARIAALEGMLKATEDALEKCRKENEEFRSDSR